MPSKHVSDRQFRAIFENAIDALFVIHGESRRIIEVNRAAADLLGFKMRDLIGRNFTSFIPAAGDMTAEEIRSFGSVFVQEFRKSDGTVSDMDMTLTMIPWDHDTAVLATLRDVSDRSRAEQERERLIQDLQNALQNIKTLRGLLPICAKCKKIRNDQGYWQQVEVYIHNHSEADFTHGICPDCARQLYPGLYEEIEKEDRKRESGEV